MKGGKSEWIEPVIASMEPRARARGNMVMTRVDQFTWIELQWSRAHVRAEMVSSN